MGNERRVPYVQRAIIVLRTTAQKNKPPTSDHAGFANEALFLEILLLILLLSSLFASQISIPLLFPFTLFLFLLYHFDNEDKGGMQFNLAPESRSTDIRFFFFSKLE